jgi:hypothetical protein
MRREGCHAYSGIGQCLTGGCAGGCEHSQSQRGGDGGGTRAKRSGELEALEWQVVKITCEEKHGGESFALVLPPKKESGTRKRRAGYRKYLDVVWLLTKEQVLEYAQHPRTPEASRLALQSVELGARELLATNWVDWIKTSFPITRVGAGYSCRFACSCMDDLGGTRKNLTTGRVWIHFDPSRTLREVARRRDAGFLSSGYLADWIAREPVSTTTPPQASKPLHSDVLRVARVFLCVDTKGEGCYLSTSAPRSLVTPESRAATLPEGGARHLYAYSQPAAPLQALAGASAVGCEESEEGGTGE